MEPIVVDHENRLVVEFKNKNPIALVDLTNSMLSLVQHYDKFLERSGIQLPERESQLYITEVRSGSITLMLANLVAWGYPLIQDFNTVVEFGKHMAIVVAYYLGRGQTAKPELSPQEIRQLQRLLELGAKDEGSTYQFVARDNATQTNLINPIILNSQDARTIQENLSNELKLLGEPEETPKRKALLVWDQARFSPGAKTGDRAIIEEVSTKPLKIIFQNEADKALLTSKADGFQRPWQELVYVVDGDVQTINGEAKAFKVTGVHPEDTFDPND